MCYLPSVDLPHSAEASWCLQALKPNQRQVVALRHGLEDATPRTWKEVGAEMKVSSTAAVAACIACAACGGCTAWELGSGFCTAQVCRLGGALVMVGAVGCLVPGHQQRLVLLLSLVGISTWPQWDAYSHVVAARALQLTHQRVQKIHAAAIEELRKQLQAS